MPPDARLFWIQYTVEVVKVMEGLFQPMHLIVILLIVLIIFGPGKLPELGAGLGKSIREFKKAMSDDEGKDRLLESKKEEHSERGKSS